MKLNIIALTAALASPAWAIQLPDPVAGEATCKTMLLSKAPSLPYATYSIDLWEQMLELYKRRGDQPMLNAMGLFAISDYGFAIGRFCAEHPGIRVRDAHLFFFDELAKSLNRGKANPTSKGIVQ